VIDELFARYGAYQKGTPGIPVLPSSVRVMTRVFGSDLSVFGER